MKKIFTLLAALLVGGAVASAEDVVFIGETGYETLDKALTAVKDGETINITGNTEWKDPWTPAVSNITIQAEQGVTISCYLKNKRAITLNKYNPRTVTLKNLHLDYVEQDASPIRLIEASKGVLNMENCKISNFKHNRNQDVILVSGGTGKLTNVVFENSELTEGLGEIRVGGNNLTISGTTNGSLNVEGTDRYVTVEGTMNPAAPIKVIVPENRAAGKTIVKNCTDISKFELQSENLILKVSGENIVTAVKPVVFIGETGYDTLRGAVDAAQSEDVINVTGDVTVTDRIGLNKKIIIQGVDGVNVNFRETNHAAFLATSGEVATLKNLNFVWTNENASESKFLEANAGGVIVEDCVIKDFNTSHNQGAVAGINGGWFTLKNVKFENCTVPQSEIFFGASNSTIDGTTNGAITIENDYSFSVGENFAIAGEVNALADEVTPASNAIKLYFAGNRNKNTDVVLGTNDPTKFNLNHESLELAAHATENKLIAQKKTGTGVAGVEADENAPVEYFNLNGVQVKADSMTPGVYVRRQGKNVTKVMVK